MPSALHILHVFPSFNIGGAQVRFAALAEGLGAGFSHTVVSLSGAFEAAELIGPKPAVSFDKTPQSAGWLGARLLQHRRAIAELKPDVLVTYNWGSIEWAMANALSGTPHIHIEDGFGPEETHRQLRRRVWTRRLVLRGSTVVVPSSVLETIATRIWKLDPARVRYIPNGIAPQDAYQTDIDSLGLDLPAGLPRVVWAGALRREKNPIRLLRAFAPIRDKAVLVVIGDGPERAAVEAEVERLSLGPHVRLLGRRNDARDLIMQCQVMALSSDTEQMPLTILEAMDAGLPVASVDVGDVRNMVAQENQAFVVPSSGDAFTEALETLLANAGLREEIGRANQARVREAYSRRGMVSAYDALLGLASRARRRGRGYGR